MKVKAVQSELQEIKMIKIKYIFSYAFDKDKIFYKEIFIVTKLFIKW